MKADDHGSPQQDDAGPSDMDIMRGNAPDAVAASAQDAPTTDAKGEPEKDLDTRPGEPVGEEVYVLLDLEPLGAEHTLQAGSVIELSGLDTFQPRVRLPDGTTCTAKYGESIGSCLLFGAGGGAATAAEEKPPLQYLCSTERLLKAQKPP